MNRDQVEGNWSQMKGAIIQKWGRLTDDDLKVAEGRLDAFAGRLQERYGITREEAGKQIDEFMKTHKLRSTVNS